MLVLFTTNSGHWSVQIMWFPLTLLLSPIAPPLTIAYHIYNEYADLARNVVILSACFVPNRSCSSHQSLSLGTRGEGSMERFSVSRAGYDSLSKVSNTQSVIFSIVWIAIHTHTTFGRECLICWKSWRHSAYIISIFYCILKALAHVCN